MERPLQTINTQTASSVEVPRTPQEAAFDNVTTYIAVLESNFAAVRAHTCVSIDIDRLSTDTRH